MNTSIIRLLVVGLLLISSLVVPTRSQNVDASVTSVMSELTRISIPGPGTVIGAAATSDDSFVYVGKGQTVFKIDTATNLVVGSTTLSLPHGSSFILDLAVSSDDSKVFVMSWVSTPLTQFDVLSTATLGHQASFTDDVGGHRLDVPRDDQNHFVVTGQYGWIQVDQNSLVITEDVVRHEQAKQGTVSHDGTRVYGQRMNTVSGDTAFGFSIDGTPLGSFPYGDGGGGMHYTEIDGNAANDRVVLFVGDSSITQNAYILDRNGNYVQTLNIPGLSYGTEGVDGQTVVAAQNRGNSNSENSGLAVVKIAKHPTNGWYQTQKLVLDDFGLRFSGDIITTPSLNRYYVNSPIGDEVIVVADGPQNVDPDCSVAAPSTASIWPPNHKMHNVSILGVSDSDGDTLAINIDSISQDESVSAKGSGATGPDGYGVGTSTVSVRAERSGNGDGRYYEIGFTATDGNGGSCSATVEVTVPKSKGKNGVAVNSGAIFDSTLGS